MFDFKVDLLKAVDEKFKLDNTSVRRYTPPKEPTIWPTESSIEYKTDNGLTLHEGKCHRAIYYRLNKYPVTEDIDSRMYWIWATGFWWEHMCQEVSKELGILAGKSLRIYDTRFSPPISGEIDAVNTIPNTDPLKFFVIDYKTTGGSYYGNVKLMGNRNNKPFPKPENLMQLMVYLGYDKKLEFGMLVYLIRDRMERTQFEIELVEHNNDLVAKVNGIIYPKYSLNEIYRRYKKIGHEFETKQLPNRDYDIVYSNDKVEKLREEDLIAKTKYEKHLKGSLAGDWQCSYCPYKDQCIKDGDIEI